MLVLRGKGQDDEIPRPTPLPQRHTGGSQSRGVGRKEPGRNKGPTIEPKVGEQAATVPRTVRGGKTVEGGVEEDEAHAARMDDWIIWEAEEEGGRAP
jgi:hypothetical protein